MKERAVRVLLVHTYPLDHLGGAELALRHHVAHAPAHVAVRVIQPHQEVDLSEFDAVILANLRPAGGVGEDEECASAERWLRRLGRYRGYVLRMEHDLHPCGQRDGRCVSCPLVQKQPCICSQRIPAVYTRLYNRCQAVQFQSPLHRRVISAIITFDSPPVVIAPPIDLRPFQNRIPWDTRRKAALIVGDALRVAETAEQRAVSCGYEPVRVPYLSVPYALMPDLLNAYQAVVVDPVMFHAFGRIVVEAKACGCDVLTGPRVGAMSWEDPVQAVRDANRSFWALLLQGMMEGEQSKRMAPHCSLPPSPIAYSDRKPRR